MGVIIDNDTRVVLQDTFAPVRSEEAERDPFALAAGKPEETYGRPEEAAVMQ